MVFGWHLVLPASIAPIYSIGVISYGQPEIKLASEVPDMREKASPSLVAVNSSMVYKLFYLPFEFDFIGHSLLASINTLAPGLSAISVRRTGDRVFVVRGKQPIVINQEVDMALALNWKPILDPAYFHQLLQGLITNPQQIPVLGEVRTAGRISVKPTRMYDEIKIEI